MSSILSQVTHAALVVGAAAMTCWISYLVVFSVAGILRRPRAWQPARTPRARIAVLVPAYREDAVIVHTAAEALRQDYPRSLFDVVVVADRLADATLEALREMDLRVIEIDPQRSTKAIALNMALENLDSDEYDLVVVLDADNIMARDVLRRFDAAYADGILALQGHRIAKNLETPYARLDALSEEVNNHIFRRGHAAVGLSAALIGSGMAIDFRLFTEIMKPIREFSEDKEIELALLRRRVRTWYVEDAVIYDEKVSSGAVFAAQRSRWIEGQRRYRRQAFLTLPADVRAGGLDYLNKLVQLTLPPRGTLLVLAPALAAAALITGHGAVAVWGLSLVVALGAAIGIAVPWNRLGPSVWSACRVLPVAVIRLAAAFVTSRNRALNAAHTPHTAAGISTAAVSGTAE